MAIATRLRRPLFLAPLVWQRCNRLSYTARYANYANYYSFLLAWRATWRVSLFIEMMTRTTSTFEMRGPTAELVFRLRNISANGWCPPHTLAHHFVGTEQRNACNKRRWYPQSSSAKSRDLDCWSSADVLMGSRSWWAPFPTRLCSAAPLQRSFCGDMEALAWVGGLNSEWLVLMGKLWLKAAYHSYVESSPEYLEKTENESLSIRPGVPVYNLPYWLKCNQSAHALRGWSCNHNSPLHEVVSRG